jgi:hypothetical protein
MYVFELEEHVLVVLEVLFVLMQLLVLHKRRGLNCLVFANQRWCILLAHVLCSC